METDFKGVIPQVFLGERENETWRIRRKYLPRTFE